MVDASVRRVYFCVWERGGELFRPISEGADESEVVVNSRACALCVITQYAVGALHGPNRY